MSQTVQPNVFKMLRQTQLELSKAGPSPPRDGAGGKRPLLNASSPAPKKPRVSKVAAFLPQANKLTDYYKTAMCKSPTSPLSHPLAPPSAEGQSSVRLASNAPVLPAPASATPMSVIQAPARAVLFAPTPELVSVPPSAPAMRALVLDALPDDRTLLGASASPSKLLRTRTETRGEGSAAVALVNKQNHGSSQDKKMLPQEVKQDSPSIIARLDAPVFAPTAPLFTRKRTTDDHNRRTEADKQDAGLALAVQIRPQLCMRRTRRLAYVVTVHPPASLVPSNVASKLRTRKDGAVLIVYEAIDPPMFDFCQPRELDTLEETMALGDAAFQALVLQLPVKYRTAWLDLRNHGSLMSSKMEKASAASNDADEGYYTVESILQRRLFRGKAQYLVKWIGYSNHYNTWEPRDNLQENCAAMVAAFDAVEANIGAAPVTSKTALAPPSPLTVKARARATARVANRAISPEIAAWNGAVPTTPSTPASPRAQRAARAPPTSSPLTLSAWSAHCRARRVSEPQTTPFSGAVVVCVNLIESLAECKRHDSFVEMLASYTSPLACPPPALIKSVIILILAADTSLSVRVSAQAYLSAAFATSLGKTTSWYLGHAPDDFELLRQACCSVHVPGSSREFLLSLFGDIFSFDLDADSLDAPCALSQFLQQAKWGHRPSVTLLVDEGVDFRCSVPLRRAILRLLTLCAELKSLSLAPIICQRLAGCPVTASFSLLETRRIVDCLDSGVLRDRYLLHVLAGFNTARVPQTARALLSPDALPWTRAHISDCLLLLDPGTLSCKRGAGGLCANSLCQTPESVAGVVFFVGCALKEMLRSLELCGGAPGAGPISKAAANFAAAMEQHLALHRGILPASVALQLALLQRASAVADAAL